MSRNDLEMEKGMENSDFDFTGHIRTLEDAVEVQTPVDDKTLSDRALEEAGLVKTSAFVRTKKSKNALRVKKHKEKKAAKGIKQVNVEIPEASRDVFKEFAKKVTAGEISNAQIKQLIDKKEKPEQAPVKSEKTAERALEVGFKARLLAFITRLLS